MRPCLHLRILLILGKTRVILVIYNVREEYLETLSFMPVQGKKTQGANGIGKITTSH